MRPLPSGAGSLTQMRGRPPSPAPPLRSTANTEPVSRRRRHFSLRSTFGVKLVSAPPQARRALGAPKSTLAARWAQPTSRARAGAATEEATSSAGRAKAQATEGSATAATR